MEKERIQAMTREQYDAQVASAKRELRRLKNEVKDLVVQLKQVVADCRKR